MKNAILTIAILTLILTTATAQGVTVTNYIERTTVNTKIGTAIGYAFSPNVEIGGFYQRSPVVALAEEGTTADVENQFFGAYMTYPFIASGSAAVSLKVRTGVINNQHFMITPSVQGSFEPIQHVKVFGDVGVRAFRPTFMAGINIRINSWNPRN
ncbi:hypothetical protein [Marinoscillum furvescens]|uniref:Outer membrane protein with beta-barrel domain n=1 Tax=Marinoscillum furvescens DSM 4134 TaxID=1122208 RepID=A0A3D9LH42_MARFU|nr:hypothetical protein [Marinoscillum furvescens]REE05957.1 hypothetical protein C7460_101476 [Marinoscillum furvescens DSM 4134]